MLLGKVARLERDLPQCLLRVARFRGVDRSEFLDNRQLLLFTIFRIASVRLIRDSWDSFPTKYRYCSRQVTFAAVEFWREDFNGWRRL